MNFETHKGRVAMVTGAAKGIGQELCVQLASRGARVAMLDIDDCTETWRRIRAIGGEALVNNAGIYPFAMIEELDLKLWSKVLRVNLNGPFLGAKAVVPIMKERRWGRIVNVSS